MNRRRLHRRTVESPQVHAWAMRAWVMRVGVRGFAASVLIAAGFARAFGQSGPVSTDLSPPVQLTREQDHQRLMDLLHISELRRGPDGDPTSPDAANFDESKVTPYRLPDPLVLKSG
jgi:hypothetical protein